MLHTSCSRPHLMQLPSIRQAASLRKPQASWGMEAARAGMQATGCWLVQHHILAASALGTLPSLPHRRELLSIMWAISAREQCTLVCE